MWKDILKRKKFYASKVDSLVNEVYTGKIIDADFKEVKQLLADEDLTVRFHVEVQVQGGEFTGLFTIAARTFTEFLARLATNLVGTKIPELGREFSKKKDTIRIYSTDM